MLFEPMTPLTALNLQRKVAEVLNNFEPRINLQQVLANPDLDRNSYSLKLYFMCWIKSTSRSRNIFRKIKIIWQVINL